MVVHDPPPTDGLPGHCGNCRIDVGGLRFVARTSGEHRRLFLLVPCPHDAAHDFAQPAENPMVHDANPGFYGIKQLSDLDEAWKAVEEGRLHCYDCVNEREAVREKLEIVREAIKPGPTLAEQLEQLIRKVARDELDRVESAREGC